MDGVIACVIPQVSAAAPLSHRLPSVAVCLFAQGQLALAAPSHNVPPTLPHLHFLSLPVRTPPCSFTDWGLAPHDAAALQQAVTGVAPPSHDDVIARLGLSRLGRTTGVGQSRTAATNCWCCKLQPVLKLFSPEQTLFRCACESQCPALFRPYACMLHLEQCHEHSQ